MEILKDDEIFSIIDTHTSLNEENNSECLIKLSNSGEWSETEFNNFINVMKTEKYEENIEKQALEVIIKDYILEICESSNILKYSQNPTYINYDNKNVSWYKYKTLLKHNCDNLFNSNLLFKSTVKKSMSKENIPDNWDDKKKFFKINKRIIYTDKKTNVRFIVNICKCNKYDFEDAGLDELHNNIVKSKIIKSSQKYEFFIDITNASKDIILQSLIKMEQALYLSPFIISKKQQNDIVVKYSGLVSKDISVRYNKNTYCAKDVNVGNNKKSDSDKPVLLTPKPITLEKFNILEPDEYTGISILSEYTVTEKADGERLLMFIDDIGNVYLIDNTYKVFDTGLRSSKELYNSLIDGEYISCDKRTDKSSMGLYAAFDMYYYGGNRITSLPLIEDDSKEDSRYKYLVNTKKYIKSRDGDNSVNYIVKEHIYSKNILKDCDNILKNVSKYPYSIDGLIFTPAKLALLSYYSNKPVEITRNLKWDRVFKWKPPEQNSIDFFAKFGNIIMLDGAKYREVSLMVGYNSKQYGKYNINDALREIYDKEYREKNTTYKYSLKLFKPDKYYSAGIEKSYIKLNSRDEARCESGELIDGDKIIEYRYLLDENITPSMRWIPMRLREDKMRIYNMGEISKTANDYSVAINIWGSIHNPVTESIIRGKAPIIKVDINNELLQADDVYYSRKINRDELLSVNMQQFHNICIKNMLYAQRKNKGGLLELACGEGGDMNRWVNNDYKFVLGIDYVKHGIYNTDSGAYSRLINKRCEYFKNTYKKFPLRFPDIVYAAGDCGKSIANGDCSLSIDDEESANIIQLVLNKKAVNVPNHYKYIVGKGANGFDVCSCMFAIHYFFETEEKINGFLNNVSSMLRKGGEFVCTFMDGKSVVDSINANGGDKVEGRKKLNKYKEDKGVPLWAIIRRYDNDVETDFKKKVDVYIEATKKFIPEFIVNFDVLVRKCKEYNLEFVDSELFSQTFNKIKSKYLNTNVKKNNIYNIINDLDKEEELKQFSFFNRWCVFKRV